MRRKRKEKSNSSLAFRQGYPCSIRMKAKAQSTFWEELEQSYQTANLISARNSMKLKELYYEKCAAFSQVAAENEVLKSQVKNAMKRIAELEEQLERTIRYD